MSETASWYVKGSDWTEWSEVARILAQATCVWADLAGLHVGSVPKELPVATHLWAWEEGVMHRVRIDSGSAVIASLSTRRTDDSIEVAVSEQPGEPWDVANSRLGANGKASMTEWTQTKRPMKIVTALLEAPITFAAAS